MKKNNPKDKPLKASLEYEPTPNGEERLNKIFELLLFKQNRFNAVWRNYGAGNE